ncbi:MAG: caspase family protein [Bacteroidia bacterium]|nr:caspase family protein [Bacteroidia bacterium]
MKRSICFILLFFIHYFSLITALSQSVPPTITLNTEMHTSAIYDIAVDAQGKYILTCSTDKTAKLWNAANGSFIRTFRIPIYTGVNGSLLACALSPDGNKVVVGGWTDDYFQSVYIFDTQTGIISQVLVVPNIINDLEFSPDGKYLAMALRVDMHDNSGVYIYENSDQGGFRLFKQLSGYEETCYGISFDRECRMATVSWDGKIRLYDAGFSLITERSVQEGRHLYSVAFSPDGSKLAVGCYLTQEIEVLDGKNLLTLFKPDVTGSKSEFSFVSFSSDGKYLYANGVYCKNTSEQCTYQVRRWDNTDEGNFIDIPVGEQYIRKITPLKGGDMVFCGGKPEFGRISSKGILGYEKTGEIQNFHISDSFTINNNGTVVGVTPADKPGFIFSVGEKKLMINESEKKGYSNELHPYCDSTANIRISNWFESESPKLNGNKVLSMPTGGDRINCMDVADNEQNIVFGTSLRLICTNNKGEFLWWKYDLGGAHFGVNISGNGKTVATMVQNGTINWYRVSDGQILLTLFIHSDNKRWIMYTPSGYYDCSPGAENLIGWNVNNLGPVKGVFISQLDKDMPAEKAGIQLGDSLLFIDNIKITSSNQASDIWVEKNKLDSFKMTIKRANRIFDIYVKPAWSDFYKKRRIGIYVNDSYHWVKESSYYPADRFFETYYRPDLIQEIFKNYETDQEILKRWGDQANSVSSMKKPPLVKIIFSSQGRNSVENITVNVEVTDQGGGIDEILLFQNGKLVETTQRGFKPLEENGVKKTRTYQLTLSNGENKIKASAFSTQRIESNPDEITLNYAGAEKSTIMYLFVLGINNYKNSRYNLNYARADAQSILQTMLDGSKSIFKDVKVYELYDDQATRANIETKINEIASLAGQNDLFVFFYAGHGAMSEPEVNQQPLFYLIPSDVTKLYGDNDILKNLAISSYEVRDWCRNIKAQKQLIMMDACQSGGVVEAFAMRGAAEDKAILQLARSAGVAVFASTGTDQYAAEFTQIGHGVFTYAVLDGLSGNADGGVRDKKITVKELEAYINDLIPELTKKYRGQAQYPNSFSTGMDFPIIIVK